MFLMLRLIFSIREIMQSLVISAEQEKS